MGAWDQHNLRKVNTEEVSRFQILPGPPDELIVLLLVTRRRCRVDPEPTVLHVAASESGVGWDGGHGSLSFEHAWLLQIPSMLVCFIRCVPEIMAVMLAVGHSPFHMRGGEEHSPLFEIIGMCGIMLVTLCRVGELGYVGSQY